MMRLLLLLSCLYCCCLVTAQHTFSIVAIDPVTREIGSAGATCLGGPSERDGAYVIKDIVPDVGAVNSQSFYIPANQSRANARLLAGDDAAAIIDYVENNDIQNRSALRQYGAVTIDAAGQIIAAAFTGEECFDYAGSRVGQDYAIQGNILLGPQVLDSMEARYLRSAGLPLADRLMQSMQGANVAGADVRCLSEGVSSQSAYLSVARPTDSADAPYIDIVVAQTPVGSEPIDVLQQRYTTVVSTITADKLSSSALYPNPATDHLIIEAPAGAHAIIYDVKGQSVLTSELTLAMTRVPLQGLRPGYYIAMIAADGRSWHHSFIKQ